MYMNKKINIIRIFIVGLLVLHGSMFAVRRLPTSMLRPPRVTVVIVVDSLGYHYIQKLLPYFNYGFKTLIEKGVVYSNAYWPHGNPSTGPGHAGLNTGVYGKDSGIVGNAWFDNAGNKVECDNDSSPDAAVLCPNGVYEYGKSPKNIMVAGVSDSLAMQSQPCAQTKVFSISLKSRAAIGTAGKDKRNKPFWFDTRTGCMTSSKYYCQTLPDWLVKFNKENNVKSLKMLAWDLLYPEDSEYYCLKGIHSNGAARLNISLLSQDATQGKTREEFFELFEKTPMANQMIFDCARACIKANLSCNRDDRMLVWVLLSPLDKLSHIYGPDSLEVTDLLYQLDYQLNQFIHCIDKLLMRSDVTYVLTADHGMAPVPEYLQEAGFPACRKDSYDIEQEVSDVLKKKLGKTITVRIKTPHVYLTKGYELLNDTEKKEVLKVAKGVLRGQPCIKNVWTNDELDALNMPVDQIEMLYKLQRFPGRSGDLIIQTAPFAQLTKYKGGTTHEGPYEVNTHVPLILYRHNFFERKLINTKVSMLQLANTLAHILHIPKAAASTFSILPGLFPDEQDFVL